MSYLPYLCLFAHSGVQHILMITKQDNVFIGVNLTLFRLQ
jgi:hypothetical protein